MKSNSSQVLTIIVLLVIAVGACVAWYFETEQNRIANKDSKVSIAKLEGLNEEVRVAKEEIRIANEQISDFKLESGYIEVEDPNRVHLRPLHSDGFNFWQFQIYLPENHGLVCEILLGDPANPDFYVAQYSPQAGQYTTTVHDMVFEKNGVELQSFSVRLGGTQRSPDKLMRHGVRWPTAASAKFLTRSRYKNLAHTLENFRLHGEVTTFGIDEEIPLLLVKPAKIVANAPSVISIKLKPKASIKLKPRNPY